MKLRRGPSVKREARSAMKTEKSNMRARHTRNVGVTLAGVLVLPILVLAQTAASRVNARYTVGDLGALASKSITFARGLNLAGQVAGLSGESTGSETRAVLWTTGGMEILGTLRG